MSAARRSIALAIAVVVAAAGEKSALAQQPEPRAAKPESESPVFSVRWDDHPSLRIADVARIDLRAWLQMDRRRSDAPFDADETTSQIRKRVGIDGEVAGVAGFQIEREIGGDPDPWRDVYINYQQFTVVQLQYGKFKLPFGLEENTSIVNLDFVHRSRLSDQLVPGRDRGVMAHGQLFGRRLRYELGRFEHDGVNGRRRISDRVHGGSTVAGRITARPLRGVESPLADLQAGVAFTQSELPQGFSALHGLTVFGAEFYEPYVWVKGTRQRMGFEARWRPGPFSLKGEYVRVTEERQDLSVEVTDLPPTLAAGWYVSGTWAVTGERKSAGLGDPRRPITRGGPGAIELAIRVEAQSFSSVATDDLPSTSRRAYRVFGNRLEAATIGVNWHPMRWIRLQINFIRESIDRPEQGPLPAQPSFWSRAIRFQVAM